MQTLRRLTGLLLSVGLLAVSAFALLQRQAIADWWRLRDYTPPASIVVLAENTTMSEYGKRLFYVHHPRLEDSDEFNKNCTITEQTIILGCYITHQSIHIFDVQDERLQGIREVTAAHEMLHAAYDRLGDAEKAEVNAQLLDYYDSVKQTNGRLRSVIEAYAERDTSIVANELHSILATEIESLPSELEAYYARYFTDRQAVVRYSKQYEDVFLQQQQRIQILAAEIEALEADLKNRHVKINELESALHAEAARLNQLRAREDVAQYNAAVPGYNNMVNQYRSMIEIYNADVHHLNDLIAEYNKVANEQKELYDAIDSREQQLSSATLVLWRKKTA